MLEDISRKLLHSVVEVEKTLEVINRITDRTIRERQLSRFAITLANKGFDTKVCEIVENITDSNQREIPLWVLCRTLSSNGKIEEATKLIDSMSKPVISVLSWKSIIENESSSENIEVIVSRLKNELDSTEKFNFEKRNLISSVISSADSKLCSLQEQLSTSF